MNIPETLCTFNGLNWITTSKDYFTVLINHIDQNGELEKRANNFILRNVYDKIRDIQEQVYKGKWADQNCAAAIERKWT